MHFGQDVVVNGEVGYRVHAVSEDGQTIYVSDAEDWVFGLGRCIIRAVRSTQVEPGPRTRWHPSKGPEGAKVINFTGRGPGS